MYIKPLKIRNLELKNNIFLAPMAGITDSAFRKLCVKFGIGMVYTEMTSTQSLFYNNPKGLSLLDFGDNERPIGIQLMGSLEEKFEKSVALAEKYNFDLIDVNCGCPVKKVVKSKGGSYLLQQRKLLEELFIMLRKLTDKPLTAKLRLGWSDDDINILENALMLESVGVDAIVLHARTRSQGNTGPVQLEYIKLLKEKLKIPIIGNGGIYTVEDAYKMFSFTNCDGIMLGMGIFGNPWFIEDVIKYLENDTKYCVPNKSFEQKFNTIIEHLGLSVESKGERRGAIEFRKHLMAYTKNMPNSAKFRNDIPKCSNYNELLDYILKYKDMVINCMLEN